LSGGNSSPGDARAPARRSRSRLLASVAGLAFIAFTTTLGNWQMRRAAEKEAILQQRAQLQRAAPVAVPAVRVDPAALDGLRVMVRGEFVPERAVFVDNRSRNGVAGFHLAMPVRIEGSDLHVLVLRGWLPRDPVERTRLPAVETPAGVVEVTGIAEAVIPQAFELKASPAPGPTDRIWQNLDFGVFEAWSRLEVQRVLIRQSADPGLDDGLVREWPVPPPSVEKHHAYAFQWYTVAATAAGLWVYFSFFRRRTDSES
jgi:cytochrome oxidase assembly protein ShyY1